MAGETDLTDLLGHVDVEDPLDRERKLAVGVRGSRVALVLPPGEGLSMSPAVGRMLVAYLREAIRIAESEP